MGSNSRAGPGRNARQKVETAILAVLADYIPVWEDQHAALNKIIPILYPGDDFSERAEMERAVADIMEWDDVLNRGRIQGLSSILLSQHYTPKQLRSAYRLHPDSPWGKDWRSEGGRKPPSERGLRDTVAQLVKQDRAGDVVDLDG